MDYFSNQSSSNSIVPSQGQNLSFKIMYKEFTKRINEKPNSLQELKEMIKKIYNLASHKPSDLKVFVLERNSMNFSLIGDKKYIQSEKDYQELIIEYDQMSSGKDNALNEKQNLQGTNQTIKLFLEISEGEENFIKNDSNISESNEKMDNKIKKVVDSKFTQFEEKINSLMDNFSNSQLNIGYSNIFKSVRKQNNNQSNQENNQINPTVNNSSIFYIQCNICLNYPILNAKYICLICDDLILCQNCESKHNHPVIKFKSSELSSKEDTCNLILSNTSTNKKTFKEILLSKHNILSKFKDNFLNANKYKVDLHMISDYYFIKKNSVYQIPITITNEGANSLPQDTYIYIKNCRDLFFNTQRVGKLFSSKESLTITLDCQTFETLAEYELEVHVYQKDVKIEYEPLTFKVKVCDNIYEDESNLFKSVVSFSPEDTVSTLPGYKKEVLSEIIRRNLSNKDILEICSILDKFNWKLTEEAIKLIADK